MVQAEMKKMFGALVLVIAGLALTPVVFDAVNEANWTIVSGGTTYSLSFLSYIIALIWAFGIAFLAFKLWDK